MHRDAGVSTPKTRVEDGMTSVISALRRNEAWDGRERADHTAAREREPRADRFVPGGKQGVHEPVPTGPRRRAVLHPDGPGGGPQRHRPGPSVLPGADGPPRRGRG